MHYLVWLVLGTNRDRITRPGHRPKGQPHRTKISISQDQEDSWGMSAQSLKKSQNHRNKRTNQTNGLFILKKRRIGRVERDYDSVFRYLPYNFILVSNPKKNAIRFTHSKDKEQGERTRKRMKSKQNHLRGEHEAATTSRPFFPANGTTSSDALSHEFFQHFGLCFILLPFLSNIFQC